MALETTLGGRLLHRLLNYSADGTSGVWGASAGGVSASRLASGGGTAGPYPSVGTTPGGQTYPLWGDATARRLQSGAMSAFPTYSAAHRKMWGMAFILDAAGAGSNRWIYGVDSPNYYVTSGNQPNVGGITTLAGVSHGVWHTLIATWDGTTARLYLDKVFQASNTSDFSATWRSSPDQWYGDRPGGGYPYRGGMLSMFWAFDASAAFTVGDVDAIHDDLMLLVLGGGGGGPVSFAGSAAGAATTTGAIRVVRSFGGLSAGVATPGALLLRRNRPFAGSAAGVATAGALLLRQTRPLSGSAAGVATTANAIRVSRPFSGTAAGVATTSARISVLRRFGGTAAGVSTGLVDLTVTPAEASYVYFAGSAHGVSTATASLSVQRRLSPLPAAGNSSGALVLGVRRGFSPLPAAGTSSGTLLLGRRRGVSGSAAGSTSVPALRVDVRRGVSGSAAGSSGSQASLSVVRSYFLTAAGFATATVALTTGSEGIIPTPASYAVILLPEVRASVPVSAATTASVRFSPMPLHVGDTVNVGGVFRDAATNALIDPSALRLEVQSPSQYRAKTGEKTVYAFGTDPNVTRLSLGTFRAAIDLTEPGKWRFSWRSPGPVGKVSAPADVDVEETI